MGLNRDKSLFYYSIANMLDAGASLVPALRQEFPRRFNGVAGALFTAIDAGHNLSSAMAEHSVFSHFECMLISVGEHSGMLPQVLKTLAEWFHYGSCSDLRSRRSAEPCCIFSTDGAEMRSGRHLFRQ